MLIQPDGAGRGGFIVVARGETDPRAPGGRKRILFGDEQTANVLDSKEPSKRTQAKIGGSEPGVKPSEAEFGLFPGSTKGFDAGAKRNQ